MCHDGSTAVAIRGYIAEAPVPLMTVRLLPDLDISFTRHVQLTCQVRRRDHLWRLSSHARRFEASERSYI